MNFNTTYISTINLFISGPPITWTTQIQAKNLPINATELATGPFGLKSPLLTTYHQQLWIIAEIETQNRDGIYINR